MSPPPYPSTMVPNRNRVVWVVVGICVAALLVVVLIPVAGFVIWVTTGPDIDEPRQAADRFVRQLERGDDAAAYASTCPEVQARITVAGFSAAVERLGRPVSHELTSAVFGDEAGGSAFVRMRLTDAAGDTTAVSLHLEADPAWRVCDDLLG
ncbi:hypothetical protein GCE86_29105 [Micromonospora terminaliae]|uniref:DUF4878 domain-containing protein n=1 Tax=Micromonospora terminaliae TaxID=1914461 RepID=A0AAJ2ZAS0_9ACTN|nr:hypothetical protein [Micromonospora terminaliae]NES26557.1 hypothetical protein [Micromonospora terminaliae]QGL50725.1 hypothetical protein GCE86_29105 [Micromonospora terminaliae]